MLVKSWRAFAPVINSIRPCLERSVKSSSPRNSPLRFCVVGSGPAGFYTAETLLKRFENANVDILERLPTPFGLVRSGVAPDHPETKNVINQFTRVASSPGCHYFGGIQVGHHISIQDLRPCYHAIILSYGAEGDRLLGVPGEGLKGVYAAREFVGWYNGHPEHSSLPVDLTKTDTAVIFGQGNVALDVARIMLRDVAELAKTDIASYALEELKRSSVRKVKIVGRRGPAQLACTAKELRELLNLRGVKVNVQEDDLQLSDVDQAELKKSRSHKRVFDLLSNAACTNSHRSEASREVDFVFFRSPNEIIPSMEDSSAVGGVKLQKTVLEGGAGGKPQRAVGINEFDFESCGLVFRSVGYKSLPLSGVPFDFKRGIVPNRFGRVLKREGNDDVAQEQFERGLYVSGWVKRGPSGIIGSNLICAQETVESIAEDIEIGRLDNAGKKVSGTDGLMEILIEKNIDFISFEGWKHLNEEEIRRGNLVGKVREKLVSLKEMYKIVNFDGRD